MEQNCCSGTILVSPEGVLVVAVCLSVRVVALGPKQQPLAAVDAIRESSYLGSNTTRKCTAISDDGSSHRCHFSLRLTLSLSSDATLTITPSLTFTRLWAVATRSLPPQPGQGTTTTVMHIHRGSAHTPLGSPALYRPLSSFL